MQPDGPRVEATVLPRWPTRHAVHGDNTLKDKGAQLVLRQGERDTLVNVNTCQEASFSERTS